MTEHEIAIRSWFPEPARMVEVGQDKTIMIRQIR